MTDSGITDVSRRAGVAAGLRRVLLAFGAGGAVACLAWLALWLAMHL